MVTCRHWSVSWWRDPHDVTHCWILPSDKAEWRLIPATLCRWRRCFLADQLWFMTCIREEEEDLSCPRSDTVIHGHINRSYLHYRATEVLCQLYKMGINRNEIFLLISFVCQILCLHEKSHRILTAALFRKVIQWLHKCKREHSDTANSAKCRHAVTEYMSYKTQNLIRLLQRRPWWMTIHYLKNLNLPVLSKVNNWSHIHIQTEINTKI